MLEISRGVFFIKKEKKKKKKKVRSLIRFEESFVRAIRLLATLAKKIFY